MSGSNEGNEGNEGNAGSLGRGGGGGFGVLPDRVDLPFVTLGNIAQRRLPRTGWRERDWAGDKAAVLTLVDFAQLGALLYRRPSPTATPTAKTGNVGDGTLSAVSALPYAWQAGNYTLECVDAGENGTFELRDPQNRLILRFAVGSASPLTVTRELIFTLSEGGTPFQRNDAFTITVSPGTTRLWLESPFIFRARLPARIDVTKGANTGNGTCDENGREPALAGIRAGRYRLACTEVDGTSQAATFTLTDPDGKLVATYTHPNAAGARLSIANQVHCLLTAGSTAFVKDDAFTITVVPRPKLLAITPRPAGNQGIGTCTPVGSSQDGARIGIYTLRCTQQATVGGTPLGFTKGALFSLFDPDGVAVAGPPITLTTGASSSFTSASSPFFTITDGDPARRGTLFQVGDGFDLDVGGFLDMELDALVRAAEDERSDALGEIVAQSDSFIDYFLAAMTISPKSYPRTCLLLQIGSLVGAYVSMHFKGVYQRARPTQTAPALLPPIPVPGHPAYPSGHSTQAHLMMRCALAGMPNEVSDEYRPVLRALADRIARNREIAGLHFPSDSAAGEALAGRIFAILDSSDMPATLPQSIPPDSAAGTDLRFRRIIDDARREWR